MYLRIINNLLNDISDTTNNHSGSSNGVEKSLSYLSSSSSSSGGMEPLEETMDNHWSGVPYMNRAPRRSFNSEEYKIDKKNNINSISGIDKVHTSKHWPSLQIICPDQISISGIASFTELKSAHESPKTTCKLPLNVTIGSPIKSSQSNRGSASLLSTAHPYYPMGMSSVNTDELIPMGVSSTMPYPKVGGMNYTYSPSRTNAFELNSFELNNRSSSSSLCSPMNGGSVGGMSMSGYRSTKCLTPTNSGMGSMSMSMSNVRSPVNRVDRRFMEPLDGYIYQVACMHNHSYHISIYICCHSVYVFYMPSYLYRIVCSITSLHNIY